MISVFAVPQHNCSTSNLNRAEEIRLDPSTALSESFCFAFVVRPALAGGVEVADLPRGVLAETASMLACSRRVFVVKREKRQNEILESDDEHKSAGTIPKPKKQKKTKKDEQTSKFDEDEKKQLTPMQMPSIFNIAISQALSEGSMRKEDLAIFAHPSKELESMIQNNYYFPHSVVDDRNNPHGCTCSIEVMRGSVEGKSTAQFVTFPNTNKYYLLTSCHSVKAHPTKITASFGFHDASKPAQRVFSFVPNVPSRGWWRPKAEHAERPDDADDSQYEGKKASDLRQSKEFPMDFAFIAVPPDVAEQVLAWLKENSLFGPIVLTEDLNKPNNLSKRCPELYMVHHPEGRPKQYSAGIEYQPIAGEIDGDVHRARLPYVLSTGHGSSGALLWNRSWRPLAVHALGESALGLGVKLSSILQAKCVQKLKDPEYDAFSTESDSSEHEVKVKVTAEPTSLSATSLVPTSLSATATVSPTATTSLSTTAASLSTTSLSAELTPLSATTFPPAPVSPSVNPEQTLDTISKQFTDLSTQPIQLPRT